MVIRPVRADDERGWLECRVLSFLDSQYFDDVRTTHGVLTQPSFGLVAADEAGRIVGVLDVEVEDGLATIDTIGVLPHVRREGVAHELLAAAMQRLQAFGVATLDAWTREDRAAGAWYEREGFVEEFRYLHVYVDGDQTGDVPAPTGLRPVSSFFHARIEDEIELRSRFPRVHVCRRLVRDVTAA